MQIHRLGYKNYCIHGQKLEMNITLQYIMIHHLQCCSFITCINLNYCEASDSLPTGSRASFSMWLFLANQNMANCVFTAWLSSLEKKYDVDKVNHFPLLWNKYFVNIILIIIITVINLCILFRCSVIYISLTNYYL